MTACALAHTHTHMHKHTHTHSATHTIIKKDIAQNMRTRGHRVRLHMCARACVCVCADATEDPSNVIPMDALTKFTHVGPLATSGKARAYGEELPGNEFRWVRDCLLCTKCHSICQSSIGLY